MYGWRSKIGILTPTNNTIIEPESASLAPQGVTFHSTRMVSSRTGHGSVEGLKNLVTNVDRAAEELSITGVDAMIYACLSTSFAVENWEDEFTKKVEHWAYVPTITAFQATINAIESFDVNQIAVLCPYGKELQEMSYPTFERSGITIKNLTSLHVTGLQQVGEIPPKDIYQAAMNMDLKGADLLCILATDIPTITVSPIIEKDLQIPVVSTNQALIWAALGLVGINEPTNNLGKLFNNQF